MSAHLVVLEELPELLESQTTVGGTLHARAVGDDAGHGNDVADLVPVLVVLAQVEGVVPCDQTCGINRLG